MRSFTKHRAGGEKPSKSLESLSPEDLYIEGSKSFSRRDYDHAHECFLRYIALRPDDDSAYHLIARAAYYAKDHLDGAEGYLRKAVELNPFFESRYLETLGLVYIHQGRFAQAVEVLSYAVSKDPKDDQRHTYALEYYLHLAKKKKKNQGEQGDGEEGPPAFLASDIGRWREHRRQTLFFLPSIVAHICILLLVSFLSSHPLPLNHEEEFTYVDLGAPPEEAPEEKAAPPEQAGAANEKQSAPVTPRKEVTAAELKKEAGMATGRPPGTETAPQARQDTVGSKAIADVAPPPRAAEQVKAAPLAAEKGVDVARGRRAASAVEAEVPRRSLDGMESAVGRSSRREAALGGINDRTAAAAPAAGGIFFGDMKPDKGTGQVKARAKALNAHSEQERLARAETPEKRVDVDQPGRRRADEFNPDMPRRDAAFGDLGRGRLSPRGVAGAGAPRTLDRGEAPSATPLADAKNDDVPGEKGINAGKVKGSLGVAETMEAKVARSGGGDRAASLPGGVPGRRYAALEQSPSRRDLGIQAPGAGRVSSVREMQAPASLDKKSGTAIPVPGETALPRGVYTAGTGRKAVTKNLGAETDRDEGLLARAENRISDILGFGGGKKGAAKRLEADIRRSGRLPGMVATPGAERAAGGTAVKLGGAEKSGAPGPAGPAAAYSRPSGTGGEPVLPGVKRAAEGSLGTPGGEGERRYASVAGASTRPMKGEKQPGVIGGGRRARGDAAGPRVKISSPASGSTRSITQLVRGTVSDQKVKKAILTVNGDSKVISVDGGVFEAAVAIGSGRNILTVTAFDVDGDVGKDSVALDYEAPRAAGQVSIIAPRDGQVFDVSEASTVTVKGSIPDQGITRAKLILNGNPMDIAVSRGYFEQKVAMLQSRSTVTVEAVLGDGSISRSVPVTVNTINVKPRDIMVILTWDKPHADLDLHIFGPTGGHTFYKGATSYASNEAITGGQLEQDAKGNFGPEIFTQAHADKGVYTIKSNYYYSGGDGDAHATVTVILYGDNPSRSIVRVFGPHLQRDTKSGEDMWVITKLRMPEGIFPEE